MIFYWLKCYICKVELHILNMHSIYPSISDEQTRNNDFA